MKNLLDISIDIFNFLFPKVCLICRNKITSKNTSLISDFCCLNCYNSLKLAESTEKLLNSVLRAFEEPDLFAISNVASLYSISENKEMAVIRLIYGLKYSGYTKIGVEFGRILGKLLVNYNMWNYDYIVPVPIHKAKRRERGFNQTDFIAKGVSDIINIPVEPGLLQKKTYTQTQTQLTAKQRRVNIKNTFMPSARYNLLNKKILLIDDVLTTGSTLNECATVLLEAQASFVDVATIIKA